MLANTISAGDGGAKERRGSGVISHVLLQQFRAAAGLAQDVRSYFGASRASSGTWLAAT